jgi:transcription antitermination factor NusG
MAFWACAQLQPWRTSLALHCLALEGYEVYHPRLREYRRSHGRKIEVRPPLFPGYAFIHIQLQWHRARWSPGVVRIVLNGPHPARVPDELIAEIRSRERDGLIELPKPRLEPGMRVRVVNGPLSGHLGLYAGQRPHERVLILLALLGGQQRVELAQDDIEVISS